MIEQPLVCEELLATVWDYFPPAIAPTTDDLGRVLRELHSLPAPDIELPKWGPVGTARKRITDAEALDDADRGILLEWCDRLEPEVETLVAAYAGLLVHGDAHVGNLLRRSDDRVVLCDFGSTCLGPPGVDLVAVADAEIWFPQSGEHARLAKFYGHDIITDPAWTILRRARELTFVVGGAPLMASTPGVAEEFKLRLISVLDNATIVPWTPTPHSPKSPDKTSATGGNEALDSAGLLGLLAAQAIFGGDRSVRLIASLSQWTPLLRPVYSSAPTWPCSFGRLLDVNPSPLVVKLEAAMKSPEPPADPYRHNEGPLVCF